jgi:RecA/RadA recombinase
MASKIAAAIKHKVRASKSKEKKPLGLSTGSTLLNLAISGRSSVGLLSGHYYFFVGDSASGKTFAVLTSLAEACLNSAFDKYDLIYDASEQGALMDFTKFFGKKMASRVQAPGRDPDGGPSHSATIEEFYFNVQDAIDREKPFIYVLDSMDGLTSEDESKKFEANKKLYRKAVAKQWRAKMGDDESSSPEDAMKGSYGDGKAKKNSANLRRVISSLHKSDSILVVINQTRDNIGAKGPFADKKTRSGGHALRFYATVEMWSSIRERIKKKVRGVDKPMQIGIVCEVKVKKNRVTGKERSIEIPIYYSHGIDDTGSCVRFLLQHKRWETTARKKVMVGKKPAVGDTGDIMQKNVVAPEFQFEGKAEDLVAYIEGCNKEKELRRIVTEVWDDIESQCEVKRRNKYAAE